MKRTFSGGAADFSAAKGEIGMKARSAARTVKDLLLKVRVVFVFVIRIWSF